MLCICVFLCFCYLGTWIVPWLGIWEAWPDKSEGRQSNLRTSGVQLGGEAEGSIGGLEWSDPSFLTMLCSCCPSGDETFALDEGGLEG